MQNRPNIIYLHSHDTGRRISPYGYPVHTPYLQQLAKESQVYRNAFCAAPTCSPSRAALLTGQCAHSSGMLGLHHRGFRLADPQQHLCRTLRDAGYSTTLIGVNHIVADVEEAGYLHVVPTRSPSAVDVGPTAAQFLQSKPSEPFFLDIGFVETHRGRFPARHADEDPHYMRPPAGLVDLPATREDAALFASAARIFDRGVGDVMQGLADSGMDQNTLLICTTDHGISFPRHKCTLFDGGMEVMLLMRGPGTAALPGGIPPGTVCEALISQVDLFPTLCDYIGIERPAWLQGNSLLPVIRGDASEVRESVFCEITYHAAYQPERAVRTRQHKYIRRFAGPSPQPLSNLDDGLTKNVWMENGYADQSQPEEALYDLIFDPAEQNNLAHTPALQHLLQNLRDELHTWMMRTNDPLLAGPVPLPPGASDNRFSDVSPKEALNRVEGAIK